MIFTGLILLVAILLGLIVLWSAVTNPFSRWSIVKDPFAIRQDDDGLIEIHQRYNLRAREGKLFNCLGILKSGAHIVINVFAGSPKARAKHENAIINAIHALRFNSKHPFLISGDHFVMLYPRSLGIFYNSLMDPRTARDAHDWYNRQAIYLKTLAYALEVFKQTGRLSTTIVPIWRQSVILANVFDPPADTLYSLLYAFKVLTDGQELTRLYPHIPKSSFRLQTRPAARKLFEQHKPTLQRHLENFTKEVYDPQSGLVRTDILLSGTKDISFEQSGFYQNVVLWRTQQLAMDLGLITKDEAYLADLKSRILKAFWVDSEGHFLEDLSPESKQHSYYSSDWLIILMTGFLDVRDERERQYYLRTVGYIQSEKIDHPFGLKYQQEDRIFREHFFDRHFVPDYGGTAIWSHWGMEYVKLLALLAHELEDARYIHHAAKQLEAYKENIEKYRGYPELYHQDGTFFSHLFYKSVRQTGWVVNYEQAGDLVSAVQAEAGEPNWGDKRINLILGPGAARGFMHVGAIRALTESGYKIESIIGNSSGAFIALLYAKYQDVDKVETAIRSIPFQGFLNRNGLNPMSIDREAIAAYFIDLFGKRDLTFDELGIPLAFFATNLITGQPEYLYQGEVLPALLASAMVPVINAPQYINYTPYIDGGIIYNMPDSIPVALNNTYPYVGINVAYEKKLREGNVRYARRFLIAALTYFYSRKYHGFAKIHVHQGNQYRMVQLYQIVMSDRHIHPTDFHKVRQSIHLGYHETTQQMATLFAALPAVATETVKSR